MYTLDLFELYYFIIIIIIVIIVILIPNLTTDTALIEIVF